MDQDLFHNWLEQSFIPEIECHQVPKPVLLLIDRAKVHTSLFILELCDENNIILYTYYPSSTHLLQVLDLELMGSVKMMYRQEVHKWLSNNIERSYDKLAFMEVFRIVFDKCTTVANAVKGFKKSGVFPWNPVIINDKKLTISTMFKNQSQLPDVNTSINEGDPEMSEKPKEDTGEENVTETVAEAHAENSILKKPTGMAAIICPDGLFKEVIIDGMCYTMTPLDEPKEACVPITSATVPVSSAKCSEIVDELLTMPVVKRRRLLGFTH